MTRLPLLRGDTAAALALLCTACLDAPAQAPAAASPPPAAAATPAPAPTLERSAPEPGVTLEPLTVVTPNGRFTFQVEIADDAAERSRGLMHRERLARDRGMLFIFPGPPTEQAFWMKNTPLPLDILYIQPDGRILSIARNTTPFSEQTLPSGGRVNVVLEINGGLAAELGIMPGDRVEHRVFGGE